MFGSNMVEICWKCMYSQHSRSNSLKFPWPASFDQLESPGGQEPWSWWWRFYKARIESGWHKEVQKRCSVCVFVWVLYSQPEISYQMAGCCQHNWPYVWVKPQDLRDCFRSQPKKDAKSATDYLKQPQKSYGCDPAKPCLKDGGLFLDQVPFHHLRVIFPVGFAVRYFFGRYNDCFKNGRYFCQGFFMKFSVVARVQPTAWWPSLSTALTSFPQTHSTIERSHLKTYITGVIIIPTKKTRCSREKNPSNSPYKLYMKIQVSPVPTQPVYHLRKSVQGIGMVRGCADGGHQIFIHLAAGSRFCVCLMMSHKFWKWKKSF